MNNHEAAQMFLELADLVDLAGELPFKARSYRKVADSLKELDVAFQDVVRNNGKITGAGRAIMEKLRSMAETGKMPSLEKWRQHEVYVFYPWLSRYDIQPRPLGALARGFKADDFDDLLRKLRACDLNKLIGQTRQAARRILEKSRVD